MVYVQRFWPTQPIKQINIETHLLISFYVIRTCSSAFLARSAGATSFRQGASVSAEFHTRPETNIQLGMS